MTRWQLIKELIKQSSFNSRKFLLIFGIFVLCGLVYFFWQNFLTEAEGHYYGSISEAFPTLATSDIVIEKNGGVYIDGRKQNKALKFYQDYDELRILVFDAPTTFISQFRATVHLPEDIKESDVRQITYGVHGVSSYLNYMPDSKTLVYEATGVSPGATLTVVAQLPKGLIKPSPGQRVQLILSHITAQVWLVIAIIFPLITLILMGFMIFKRRSFESLLVKKPLPDLPEQISPAVSGVIVDGAVGAREIAGTLIDLAQRGYIFIIKKGEEQFFFAKRKLEDIETTPGLSDFERALLSKIFLPSSQTSTVSDVDARIGRHIFSRKIANFYLGVYNQATRQGYFVENPARIHMVYKYLGIALFFLTFLGFGIGALTEMEPKLSLIFWIGGMASSAVIIRLAPFMPARTTRGDEELKNWLAFRDFLTQKSPASLSDYMQNKFEKYLPYAIVLGAEIEWMKRYQDKPFKQPDWYETKERIITMDSFANHLFPLIGYVAVNLAKSHDPMVE